jgi:hypothetical protein
MLDIAREVFERRAHDTANADTVKLDRCFGTQPAHAAGEEQQVR